MLTFARISNSLLVKITALALFGAIITGCTGGIPMVNNNSTYIPPQNTGLFNQNVQPQISLAQVQGEIIGQGQVRVAMLLPLSAAGGIGNMAKSMANAARLAMSDYGNSNITLIIKNTGGTARGAVDAAGQAVGEGVSLILGPVLAGSVRTVGQTARASNIPVIGFSTDVSAASPGVYLLSFLPQNEVIRSINFAARNNRRSMGALLPNTAYGTVMDSAFRQATSVAGVRVANIQRYSVTQASLKEAIDSLIPQIQSGEIDSVFIPDAASAALAAQAIKAKIPEGNNITFIGAGTWDGNRTLMRTKQLDGAIYAASDPRGFERLSQKYIAQFNEEPHKNASTAYDSVLLAASLARNSRFFSHSMLTNPNGFAGIDGLFRLKADGTNQRSLAIMQLSGGTTRVLESAPNSFTNTTGF